MGAQALGIARSVLRHLPLVHTGRESTLFMESEPAGRGDRFEGGSAFARWGSCPPLSAMEGVPPARQRDLKTRAGLAAWKIDTSTFRWPRPNRSTGPL
jgi:hypothetical protein